MPEEEKKEIIIPMDDKEFTGGTPGPPTEKEKAKFRTLMEMYNVYSEDNPQPIASVEGASDYYTKAEIDRAFLVQQHYVGKTKVKASAYLGGAQSNIANNTWLTVQCGSVYFNPGGHYDTSTYMFRTPIAGTYLVLGQVLFGTLVSDKRYGVGIYNHTDSAWCAMNLISIGTAPATIVLGCSGMVALKAKKELILRAYQDTGGALVDLEVAETRWSVHLLSAE